MAGPLLLAGLAVAAALATAGAQTRRDAPDVVGWEATSLEAASSTFTTASWLSPASTTTTAVSSPDTTLATSTIASSTPAASTTTATGGCDVATPCTGCSPEQCDLCREEERVKCCVRDGVPVKECCRGASPIIQDRPVCQASMSVLSAGSRRCDVERPCQGCLAAHCALCREEAQVKCCVRDGGSARSCCNTASAVVRDRPVCQ